MIGDLPSRFGLPGLRIPGLLDPVVNTPAQTAWKVDFFAGLPKDLAPILFSPGTERSALAYLGNAHPFVSRRSTKILAAAQETKPVDGADAPAESKDSHSYEATKEKWRKYIFDKSLHQGFERVEKRDVIGNISLLQHIKKLVADLKDSLASSEDELLADPPGGLLVGPKGTGKTHLALHIATESGGLTVDITRFPSLDPRGPTRADIRAMREAAEEYAKKNGRPVILFWDQIDNFFTSDSPYIGETTHELLTQLSGFYGRPKGVLLIATSNQPEKLPDDLVRGGRLETLRLTPPDKHGHALFLQKYVAKYPHEKGLDYKSLTYLVRERTTPADIKAMVAEAYRDARRMTRFEGKKPQITKQILTDALLRQYLGQPDDRRFTKKEERETALHEVCHAVVGKKLGQKIPVISMKSTAEQVAHADFSARGNLLTEKEMLAAIAFFQAGFVAKKLLGVELLGYSTDINLATQYAVRAVEWWAIPQDFEGFSLYGLSAERGRTHGMSPQKTSERLLERAEDAASKICREQLAVAEGILRKFGVKRLKWLAQQLIKERVILEEELDRLLAKAERKFKK